MTFGCDPRNRVAVVVILCTCGPVVTATRALGVGSKPLPRELGRLCGPPERDGFVSRVAQIAAGW